MCGKKRSKRDLDKLGDGHVRADGIREVRVAVVHFETIPTYQSGREQLGERRENRPSPGDILDGQVDDGFDLRKSQVEGVLPGTVAALLHGQGHEDVDRVILAHLNVILRRNEPPLFIVFYLNCTLKKVRSDKGAR